MVIDRTVELKIDSQTFRIGTQPTTTETFHRHLRISTKQKNVSTISVTKLTRVHTTTRA